MSRLSNDLPRRSTLTFQLVLLQTRMSLDLVDRRYNPRSIDDHIQMLLAKVRHSDRLDLVAVLVDIDHGLPGLYDPRRFAVDDGLRFVGGQGGEVFAGCEGDWPVLPYVAEKNSLDKTDVTGPEKQETRMSWGSGKWEVERRGEGDSTYDEPEVQVIRPQLFQSRLQISSNVFRSVRVVPELKTKPWMVSYRQNEPLNRVLAPCH